ncbi:hypothetical protein [Fulvivirga sedimenti]|uniref:Uncharacterized protein n=1 Tax=Fulvivirga sedimenti TaxID=2879465 RepID=A0A9X1KZS5_9BACT|nr:hypothetical protein [Fulvivirga sedimenti]MCA6075325.1 hypothetical protein [Fulvivirga sedimenti]MCA6076502.1 hypothetical protein [Fulvivirga sedimenti]MCA6077630.1 hypothetical protein [Fulvivirga sedimenti]
MNEEELRFSAKPIPEIFQSYATGTLFDRCIECDRYLLDKEIPYFIEKAIKKYEGLRGYDVIFEYAICINCADQMRQKMSLESMQKIGQFLEKNMNQKRRNELIEDFPDEPEKWIDECLITGASREETAEYQIYAQCIYDRLLLPAMPYMISHMVLDKLANLLSDKTLGEMDDFIGRHFGPPSEFEVGPRKKIILV